MKKILIGVIAAVALAALVIGGIKSGGGRKGTRVYVEEVSRRDIAQVVKASGQIDPRVKVNISAHVIGKIERLYVEEGDSIEEGDPFLELEREAFIAARDSARAQTAIARSGLRQAEINLEDAQLKLRRMERLTSDQIVSAEQLEQAQLNVKSAELRREQARESVIQAQAALDKAVDDLSKATIYAPLTGRVIALSAEEGEVVVSGTMNNPASVIGTIADLSEILAEVDIDETEVALLEVGQSALLVVDALPEREYEGTVVEIGSSGFQKPQQRDVTFFKSKVLLDAADPDLRPGMSVRAEVNTAENLQVLVAPIQSVVNRPPLEDEGREGEGESDAEAEEADDEEIDVVFVVEDDVVYQRPVETGLSDETHVEIVSGLEEGETVVTGPYRSLKDLDHEDPVRPRDEDEDEKEEDED